MKSKVGALLVSVVLAACSTPSFDVPSTSLIPGVFTNKFGCRDSGGYTVSAQFTAEERASIDAAVGEWNTEDNHVPILTKTGERHECAFNKANTPEADEYDVTQDVPSWVGSTDNSILQFTVISFGDGTKPCDAECRQKTVRRAIDGMASD